MAGHIFGYKGSSEDGLPPSLQQNIRKTLVSMVEREVDLAS